MLRCKLGFCSGSLADIASRSIHVRLAPKSDIESNGIPAADAAYPTAIPIAQSDVEPILRRRCPKFGNIPSERWRMWALNSGVSGKREYGDLVVHAKAPTLRAFLR